MMSSTLWGGRFAAAPAETLNAFSQSVSFDWRLYRHDIRGSRAHARMLHAQKLLTRTELRDIERGLAAIEADIEEGRFTWRRDLEDVHMNIEAELTQRTPAAAKLHTGRSRNDQVATDVRLWLRDTIDRQIDALRSLQSRLVDLGQANRHVLIPGYTHLQRAQPVLVPHHLLAYVEMFERDVQRLRDARVRVNICPLGSGAIAGSTLPLDRAFVARDLNFVDSRGRPQITANSMDAVSDRDFLVEYLAAAALVAVHISRLSEDLILWSSAEFQFIRIGDAFTTGSSLMPQKKNPDVAELGRGKAGRVIGNLVSLLVTLKGLPMTYNRDLQEDKERLFDTADTLDLTFAVFDGMLADIAFIPASCNQAASDPLLLATDIADALVTEGIPFRDAHHLVGASVKRAESLNVPLHELPDHEWRAISPALLKARRVLLNPPRTQLRARPMPGAPNPILVDRQLKRWSTQLNGRPKKNHVS